MRSLYTEEGVTLKGFPVTLGSGSLMVVLGDLAVTEIDVLYHAAGRNRLEQVWSVSVSHVSTDCYGERLV